MKVRKAGLAMVLAIAVIAGLMACNNSAANNNSTGTNPSTQTKKIELSRRWTVVGELEGNFSGIAGAKESDPFTLNGGKVRITVTQTAISTGGNGLIYIIPVGETISEDANGNLDAKVQDMTAIGDASEKQETIDKEAGQYFIYFNTVGLSDFKIVIEELK
ncbi:MAG: hypothetical protein LBH87_01995 [Coriobacteriales bacterium]|jgi:hypothetical protein|nr:hypothetical protein [Coriobacteriales bacterium]